MKERGRRRPRGASPASVPVSDSLEDVPLHRFSADLSDESLPDESSWDFVEDVFYVQQETLKDIFSDFQSVRKNRWHKVRPEFMRDFDFISRLPQGPVLNYEQLGWSLPAADKNRGERTLFIDLDETLAHTEMGNFSDPETAKVIQLLQQQQQPAGNPQAQVPQVSSERLPNLIFASTDSTDSVALVYFRPFVREFLRLVAQRYELVIYTASLRGYANTILNALDVDRRISHRLYREHCTQYGNSDVFFKDLHGTGRDMARSVILDNRLISFGLNVSNGVLISSFVGSPADQDLLSLLPFLLSLSRVRDVRLALQAHYGLAPALQRYRQSSWHQRLNEMLRAVPHVGSEAITHLFEQLRDTFTLEEELQRRAANEATANPKRSRKHRSKAPEQQGEPTAETPAYRPVKEQPPRPVKDQAPIAPTTSSVKVTKKQKPVEDSACITPLVRPIEQQPATVATPLTEQQAVEGAKVEGIKKPAAPSSVYEKITDGAKQVAREVHLVLQNRQLEQRRHEDRENDARNAWIQNASSKPPDQPAGADEAPLRRRLVNRQPQHHISAVNHPPQQQQQQTLAEVPHRTQPSLPCRRDASPFRQQQDSTSPLEHQGSRAAYYSPFHRRPPVHFEEVVTPAKAWRPINSFVSTIPDWDAARFNSSPLLAARPDAFFTPAVLRTSHSAAAARDMYNQHIPPVAPSVAPTPQPPPTTCVPVTFTMGAKSTAVRHVPPHITTSAMTFGPATPVLSGSAVVRTRSADAPGASVLRMGDTLRRGSNGLLSNHHHHQPPQQRSLSWQRDENVGKPSMPFALQGTSLVPSQEPHGMNAWLRGNREAHVRSLMTRAAAF